MAQFDLLRSLFGPKRAEPRVFEGDADLDAARAAAERGDVDESLKLARKAFTKPAGQFHLHDPIGQMAAVKLVALCQTWDEQQAPPAEVAAVLRAIVFPADRKGEVWPYALPWQPNLQPWNPTETRLPKPQSAAAELVKWSARAKQLEPLREQLRATDAHPGSQATAHVLSVQIAAAERNVDAAQTALKTLTSSAGQSPAAADWLLHAVTAGLEIPASQPGALALLEALLPAQNTPETTLLAESRFPMLLQAVKLHVSGNRPDDAIRLARLALEPPLQSQRYGTEMAEHIRQMQRAQMAAALLDGHRVAEALEILALRAEAPPSRYEMYYPSINVAAILGRELEALPAEGRYSLLHEWVLPAATPERFRDLMEFVPEAYPRQEPSTAAIPAAGIMEDVYSTSWHLMTTAKELGRLDALIAELAKLPPDNADATILQTLAFVVRDRESNDLVRIAQTQQRLQSLLEVTTANVPKWEDNPKRPLPMLTCVVVLEAARRREWLPVTQDLLIRLIEHSQRLQWDRPRPHLRMAWAEVLRQRGLTDEDAKNISTADSVMDAWRDLQPQHWFASGRETAVQYAGGSLPDVWIAQDDSIEHLIGRFDSTLFFEFPLQGDFELSAEVREGGWAEGASGYGGMVFATNGYSDVAPLHSLGRTHAVYGPSMANLLHRNPWNRQTVEVRDGTVRYYANGQLVHEDQPGTSSPWLCLNADWGRTPIYRNLKFRGTPVIPREVSLLTDHRLRGWVANWYSETREDPSRAVPAPNRHVVGRNGMISPTALQRINTTNSGPVEIVAESDWYFDQQELRSSRRESFFAKSSPSHIVYYRPLQPQESLEYEFFAKADTVMVHPTIGGLVLRLDERGVQIDPITAGEYEVRALEAKPLSMERKQPIKENDWNRVVVSMQTDRVHITINDQDAIEVPLTASMGREFGFWHDAAKTSVRVRDIQLRGPWPEEFTTAHRQAIERPQPQKPPQSRQFLTQAMQESILADNAYGVYQHALQLNGQARYDYLYRWVMPGPDHPTLRTTGALTPTHPAPPVLADNPIDVATAEARQQIDPRRVQTGGSFVCPAVLLVFSALELGRLGELMDALDQPVPNPTPAMVRARESMHGMIALLEDRIDQANTALWDCNQMLLEGAKLEQHERWSEPALCSLAILHPATREVAFELLDRIQRRQLQSGQPGSNEFNRYVRHLHGQAWYLLQGGDPSTFGTPPQLKQWQMVSQTCARTNGAGTPIAAFDHLHHELALRGGHDLDMVYFQSPLRGNFELRAKLTQFDYREFMPLVGGIASVVRFDGKNVKLQSIRTPLQELPMETEHTRRARSWGDYHVVVKDSHYSAFVNGQKLYEQDLPPNSDPWVALQGWAGQSARAARNVVITGSPEIPRELDLLASPELQGWLQDYYGAGTGQTPYPWRRTDDELQCPQTVVRGATPGRLKIENLIRYHRPMLEDGEITYEFFYDPEAKVAEPANPQRQPFLNERQVTNWLPGQVMVHPALDRLVCLLEPDGVKLHWLTDGRYDRTRLSPGNVTDLPNAKPLPFKKQDWNTVRFQVVDDELKITLNGTSILTHPIEPTNQRQFGLFHYVNESTARVKNVRYRGDWPLTLPSLEEQELAVGPEQDVEFQPGELPAKVSYDLTKTPLDPQKFMYVWDAKAAKFLSATPQGVRMNFPAGEQKGSTIAGFAPRVRVKGDFVATIDFEQLKTTVVKESWGSGLSFKFKMAASYEAGFEVRRTTNATSLNCAWQMPTPKGTVYYSEGFSEFPTAGRLRLVRRGAMIYYLIAEPGTDDFRLLTTRPLGATDIDRVGAQVDCSDAAGGADVLITRFTVEAAELIPR